MLAVDFDAICRTRPGDIHPGNLALATEADVRRLIILANIFRASPPKMLAFFITQR